MNDASELTIRDVLQQVDRRLTGLEEGLRELRAGIASLRSELRAELGREVTTLRGEIAVLRADTTSLRTDMTSGFRWLVGLTLLSWLSTMGMILPLLLR